MRSDRADRAGRPPGRARGTALGGRLGPWRAGQGGRGHAVRPRGCALLRCTCGVRLSRRAASGEQRGGEVRPAAWRRRAGMTVPSADGRSAPRHDVPAGPGARGFTWNDSYAPGRWVSASGPLLHVERVPEALRAPPRIERQCPRSGRGGGSGVGVERGAGTGPDLVRAPAAARLFHVEPSGRRLFDGEPSGDEMFHVEPASRRLFDVEPSCRRAAPPGYCPGGRTVPRAPADPPTSPWTRPTR